MEVETMDNFTYDGNDTNFEPLYSLKDNVSTIVQFLLWLNYIITL